MTRRSVRVPVGTLPETPGEPRLSRQDLKVRRQSQDRLIFGRAPRMVRLAKSRARAGLAAQEPKDGDWRELVYRRTRLHLTAAQRRRIDHKAHRAIAVAERTSR